MVRGLSLPETESIVMLTGKDHKTESSILQRLHPLICVQMLGDENGRILCPVSPLLIGESIDTKVDKCGQLQFLPRLLLL